MKEYIYKTQVETRDYECDVQGIVKGHISRGEEVAEMFSKYLSA